MCKQYDVIIVGTGAAGCFTAIHLAPDKQVLMITKSALEDSDSWLAQGGICVQKNNDDYDSFYEDTMKAGHYENRPESVDKMITDSREVIDELIEVGVDFEREGGELAYTREGAHSTNRILYHDDITGQEITSNLLERVKTLPNVEIREFTEMVDILCEDNRCDGILMKNRDGEYEAVFAQNVMWASGGIGGIYENSTNFPHLTGDALDLSLKHGIELQNLDYVQIHPTTLYSKSKGRRFLISESVRGEGAVLYDKNGNRFVDEVQARDVVSKAIFEQMEKDGTDHVWLDFSTIKDIDVKERFPNIYNKCLEEGYDITKDWIPVVPAQHYFMGGVRVDLHSRTSMDHLYASGETCCNGVHGANRLASNSLLESLVFGKAGAYDINESISRRSFEKFDGMSTEEIAAAYGLDLSEYEDVERHKQISKERIWKEINRMKEQREK